MENFILSKFITASWKMCLKFLQWLALSLEGELAELMLWLVWFMAEFVTEPHVHCWWTWVRVCRTVGVCRQQEPLRGLGLNRKQLMVNMKWWRYQCHICPAGRENEMQFIFPPSFVLDFSSWGYFLVCGSLQGNWHTVDGRNLEGDRNHKTVNRD